VPETVAELGVNLILQTGKFFGALDSTLGRAGQRLTAFGTKMSLALSIPLMGLIAAAGKMGMAYEDAFAEVLKSVEEATDEFGNLTGRGRELEQMFRDMAMEMPLTRVEFAKIGAIAGQLGIKGTEDIRKFTEMVAKISVATDLSVERSAIAFARLMNVMGTNLDEMDELASTVVYVGTKVGAFESEIVDLALRMAGTAAIIGMSEHALIGMSGAMRELEIRAEMGGTAMSTIMIEMFKAIKEGEDRLATFANVAGITAEEFASLFAEKPEMAVLAFVQGLQQIVDAGGNVFSILEQLKLGEKRVRETLLKMAAGNEQVAEALANAAIGWEENIALEREFAIFAATTRSQLKMLWSAITDIAVSIFQAFKPAIESALTSLVAFVQGIAMAARESPELLRIIVLIGAAIAAIGPVLVLAGTAMGIFSYAVGNLLPLFKLLLAPLGIFRSLLIAILSPLKLLIPLIGSLFFFLKVLFMTITGMIHPLILVGVILKGFLSIFSFLLSIVGFLVPVFIALAGAILLLRGAGAIWGTLRSEIHSFADAVVVASGLIARALNWIAERLSGLIDFIAQAAQWGASAMEEFARGIISAANLVISAIGYIASIIAGLLGPGSPPAILPDLANWGREAINEFLYGMTEADFDILNRVGDIIAKHLKSIGFEDEGELADAITRAQMALARVVFEARTAGEASAAAWQELRDAIHDSTGDIERYIRLRMELTQAEEELAAIEQHRTEIMDQLDEERFQMQMRHKEELRAADKKVQAAEEALQKFREETAEIPERFTRGRERQLQAELRAAQKERDSVRERHDIEMTQFEIRRHQIQETLDAQVKAAQEARDLLQKQVRWLEELIQTRLDLFESYDAEKSDLDDLTDIFADMKRNVEDIFPSMEGLTDNFNKAKEAAEGLFSIWKAFWLGLTGAPIDELDVLSYDTVRMWEAGHGLFEAWDKFIGVLDKVKTALQPILDTFRKIFAGEEEAGGIDWATIFEEEGITGVFDRIVDGIIRWIDESWPKIEAKLGEWADLFWDWVSEAASNLDQKLGPLLDELEAWIDKAETQERLQLFGLKLATFLMDAIVVFLKLSSTIAKVVAALTYLFVEVGARLTGVLARVAIDIATGFIAILGLELSARATQLNTIIHAKLDELDQAITDFFVNLPRNIATAANTFVTAVENWFIDLYNRIVGESIIPDLINKIVEWFGKLPQLLWEKVDEMAVRVVERFVELKDKLLNETIPNLINGLVGAAKSGLADLAKEFWSFKETVIGYFNDLRNSLAAKIQEIVEDALWWFSVMSTLLIGGSIVPDMISDIESAFAGMSANVIGVGEGMVGGLAAGMAGQMPGLHGALAGAGPMGGMMTGLQLNIVNHWDSSISSKDRMELQTMMENTTYTALEKVYGGAA